MSLRCRIMAVVALLAVGAAGAAFAATPYTLTDLNGTAYASQANAVATINGSPVIAGQIQTSSTAYPDACFWTGSGSSFTMTDIGSELYSAYNSTFAGTGYSWYNSTVSGINASGQIVGMWSGINSDNYIWSTPYLYSNGTVFSFAFPTNTNPPNGLPNNFNAYDAAGISNSGLVGGYGQVGIDPTNHPYTLNVNTNTFTDLYLSSGGGSGIAASVFAMNNNGWLAGTGPDAPATASVWNGSTWTDLGVPSASYTHGSRATGLDSKGDVVGVVGVATATKGDPMYVPYNGSSWNTMVDLGNLGGTLSGYTAGQANSINDNGQIVGFCFDGLKTAATEAAFLSGTTAGSMVPLSSLVANAGGWTLSDATAIGNSADIIGLGLDPTNGGNQSAFLLTPTLSGDANLDGKVDINDLTIVLAHYNQSAGVTWGQGDFTGSGKVDINDLTIVLAHYNQSVGASAGNLAAVPEPGALALLAAGVAGLLAYVGRKGK